jgi:hypothetical protein
MIDLLKSRAIGDKQMWPFVECQSDSLTYSGRASNVRSCSFAQLRAPRAVDASPNPGRRRGDMIKVKKLKLARETIVTLSAKTLEVAQGGVVTMPGAHCEPSGILPCPTQAGVCG